MNATLLTPTDAEIQVAAKVSGEHDSEYGVKCAGCGNAFEHDGESFVDRDACVDCTDCFLDPECAVNGKCPHCLMLDNLGDARYMAAVLGLSIADAFAQIQTANRRLAGIRE